MAVAAAAGIRWLEDELPLPSFLAAFGAKYVLPMPPKRKRGRPSLPSDVRKRKPKKHRYRIFPLGYFFRSVSFLLTH